MSACSGSIAVLVFGAPLGGVQAATRLSSISPTTVPGVCTTSGHPSLAFDNHVGQQHDFTTSISVSCTLTTAYQVGLGAGAWPMATVTTRRMTGQPSRTLSYRLFQDAARTINWGETPGQDTVSGVGKGLDAKQRFTVYGWAAAGQSAPLSDAYRDAIVVTMNY